METKNKRVPEGFQVLQEGQAKILYKEEKLEVDEKNMIKTSKGKRLATDQNDVRGTVFYNPVQEFNRDFSILVIREFAKLRQEELAAKNATKPEGKTRDFAGIKVLEALSATGLRSVRYMKELQPHLSHLAANDIDPTATELMKKNFDFNDIDEGLYKSKFTVLTFVVYNEDAVDMLNGMRRDKTLYDVIDLDPYGTAVPFLGSSIQAMADGGLLAVTFTDMAVLCARSPHVTFYKYGGAPLSKKYCHEVRISDIYAVCRWH